MRATCFLNFMLRYYWDKMAIADENVERIFSISSASVIVWSQSWNCTIIRWSSELNDTKSGKSNTRKLIQSVRAWGRKMFASGGNKHGVEPTCSLDRRSLDTANEISSPRGGVTTTKLTDCGNLDFLLSRGRSCKRFLCSSQVLCT